MLTWEYAGTSSCHYPPQFEFVIPVSSNTLFMWLVYLLTEREGIHPKRGCFPGISISETQARIPAGAEKVSTMLLTTAFISYNSHYPPCLFFSVGLGTHNSRRRWTVPGPLIPPGCREGSFEILAKILFQTGKVQLWAADLNGRGDPEEPREARHRTSYNRSFPHLEPHPSRPSGKSREAFTCALSRFGFPSFGLVFGNLGPKNGFWFSQRSVSF